MIYTGNEILFSVKKKCVAKTCKDMEELFILLSERSQSEKDTEGSMIITIWQPGKGKTIVIINRSVVARADGEEMNRAHWILGQWKYSV